MRLAIALALTLVALPARAYVCITGNCAPYCQKPVQYRLATTSDDLGEAGTEAELKRGMEAWAKVSCSSLQTQYGGRTEEQPSNGNGVVAWVESGWTGGSGTIGTTTIRGGRGCIQSHMRLNGVNFRWVTGMPARGQVNAFSIIAHEGGHFFGLGHSGAPGAVMQARYSGGVLSLTEDDQMGICRIYPGSGGTAAPATDCRQSGCSSGFQCVDGVCKRPPGVDAGEPVRSDAGMSSGGRDAAEMPPPPMTSPGLPPISAVMPKRDASVPPAPPVARADGAECEVNDDCRSEFCLVASARSVCTRLCRSNGDCVSGFTCRRAGTESVCMPFEGASGARDGGADNEGKSAKAATGGCSIARGGSASGLMLLLLLGIRRRR